MMKRILACLGLMALFAAAPAHADEWAKNRVIAEANQYFNQITTFRARFEQLDSTGAVSTGTAYMKRPGRARFEYDDPNPITVVADRTFVTLQDREFDTVDRYPMSSTPLGLLLAKHVDFADEAEITDIEQGPEIVRVTARDKDEPGQGQIMLEFAKQPFELRQWVITDAQGLETRVIFSELTYGLELANSLFHISDIYQPMQRN